ncbi:hypothetical protein BYT27DRAFT_7333105 [Phlegmacium glaucopus]|nr:hypothetical protein BYT27DRAFT_7333105 [Phlegmacium glaucopus]
MSVAGHPPSNNAHFNRLLPPTNKPTYFANSASYLLTAICEMVDVLEFFSSAPLFTILEAMRAHIIELEHPPTNGARMSVAPDTSMPASARPSAALAVQVDDAYTRLCCYE